MYDAALAAGHPDPKKLADTMWRSRERSLEMKASRPHVQVIPFQSEKVQAKKTFAKCKSTLLSGRPCSYAAKLGGYCAKHVPSKDVLKMSI